MAKKNGSTAHSLHEVPSIGANQCDAGTKSKGRNAKIKTVPPAPEINLTADEARIIHAYRNMKSDIQGNALNIIEAWAALPSLARRKVTPLRLIAGRAV